jgi:hypothetical protein
MRWTSAAGQGGTLRVVSSAGPHFVVEQENDHNRAAGLTRFEGEFRDGRIILVSRERHETWEGTLINGKVNGKINNRIDFSIFE